MEGTLYKTVVIGDGGVGKTTFVNSTVHGVDKNKKYVPTLGCEIRSAKSTLKDENFQLDYWDTAGPEKYGGVRDTFFVKARAVILVFDLTSRVTYKSIQNWYRDVTRVTGTNIPIVLVGNKCDRIMDVRVKRTQIKFDYKWGIPYYEISAREGMNLDLPGLYIMKWYTRHLFVFQSRVYQEHMLKDCQFWFE
jgi:GTP-binding nuclear protein Ran